MGNTSASTATSRERSLHRQACRKGRSCRSSRRCAIKCPPKSSRRPIKIRSAATGKPVTVEILVQDPSAERIALFYKPSLERIGVTTSIRVVDDAQYQNRLRSFDFDMISDLWGQSLSPGNEQREFWGSQAADQPGAKNTIGIKNPAVDALIAKVIFAKDRNGLVAATKALDRVLLWNFYVVPQFTYGFSRYARWDRFSHAEPMPKYGRSGLPSLWWFDADKAARIGKRS